jgi:hypothetical protein
MDGSVLENINPIMLVSSLVTLVVAFVQVQLVERLLKRSMRGWMLFTIAGLVTTWALTFFFQQPFVFESPILLSFYEQIGVYTSTILNVFISTVPTALFQAIWLRRQVRDTREAWLWPLLLITLSAITQGLQMYIISNRPYDTDNTATILNIMSLVMTLIYGVSTGLVMHSLISHPRETQKAKVDDVDTNLVYSSRTARLQESEQTVPSDTSAYQPPAQQKTR